MVMLRKALVLLVVSFLILKAVEILSSLLPTLQTPFFFTALSAVDMAVFAFKLTLVILAMTLLFFIGIEVGRAIIANIPVKKAVINYLKSLPKITEYHSYFKVLFFIVLVFLLYNTFELAKNPLVNPNPIELALRLLVVVGLVVVVILILTLTTYPTYKILLGETSTKVLIAYTFSLPSLLFGVLTTLILLPVAMVKNQLAQVLLLAIYFPLSWVIFYITYRLEKFYCGSKEKT